MSTLNHRQKQRLHHLLLRQAEKLRLEIQSREQALREESRSTAEGQVADSGELAMADLDASLNSSQLERQAVTLQQVERAMAQLSETSFGHCEDCGNEIGFPRLTAYPTARRCITCQAQFESRHDTHHTRTL